MWIGLTAEELADWDQAGYINEMLARLTDSEVVDSTCTNRTLDADGKTFPRGGKRMFVVGSLPRSPFFHA